MVETGIRELDVILIEVLFNSVIVVTYRYAKLISGSAWRIVDSILQIELLALRQRIKLFQIKILKLNPLYFIMTGIHASAWFVLPVARVEFSLYSIRKHQVIYFLKYNLDIF